ncbi:MAG: type II secretion system F family protein [Candidatus Firestonebacteria bacterium]
MALFKYTAVNDKGEEVSGTMEVDGKEALVAKLQSQKLIVTSMRKVSMFLQQLKGSGAKIKMEDVLNFSRQLAALVKANIPLDQCFGVLAEQTMNPKFKEIVKKIQDDIIAGNSLSTAFEKYPKLFPPLYAGMVKAGEAAGKLPVVLIRVAKYMESSARLRSKLKNAMIYPLIVICVAIAVVIFIMTVVIPQFEKLYGQFGANLPALTNVLIALSHGIGFLILKTPVNVIFFGSLFVGWVLLKNYLQTEKGKMQFDSLILKLPILGVYIQKVIFAKFSNTMGILVTSGVPILECFDLLSKTVGSKPIEKSLNEARERIKEGEKIAEALRKYAFFPPMIVQMIKVGEQTGKLGEAMDQIAEYYDEEVNISTAALMSIIEPALMLLLAGMVGSVVVGLYLPVFRMHQLLRKTY